ncbi:hypothetical protein DPMN_111175 [Dreissena polymorpha]|uniref:Uncharacterized protein n=1 Tax=Dreissena polymorpha TaxID=45954 RepID=A0A9D4KE14_DREPO|nr:hypothetical protein DPMN_111175 [Dreissena polymorpha]
MSLTLGKLGLMHVCKVSSHIRLCSKQERPFPSRLDYGPFRRDWITALSVETGLRLFPSRLDYGPFRRDWITALSVETGLRPFPSRLDYGSFRRDWITALSVETGLR